MFRRRPAIIPRLRDLRKEDCGYEIPWYFVDDFVRIHPDQWTSAQKDWERLVMHVLDTDAVSRRASGRRAMKQAVEAAVIFLVATPADDKPVWPWCPICRAKSDRSVRRVTNGN